MGAGFEAVTVQEAVNVGGGDGGCDCGDRDEGCDHWGAGL